MSNKPTWPGAVQGVPPLPASVARALEQANASVLRLVEPPARQEPPESREPFMPQPVKRITLSPVRTSMAAEVRQPDMVNTLYLSVDELRRAPRSEPLPVRRDAVVSSEAPSPSPESSRPFTVIWSAPWQRKLMMVLLLVVGGLLLLKPQLRKQSAAAKQPSAMLGQPANVVVAPVAPLSDGVLPSPVRTLAAPARGTSTQRAAVDHVAAGQYERALEAYRELSAAQPDVLAYREAVRILQLRAQGSSP